MTPTAQPPGNRQLKLDLADLADAFDDASWELRVYLDLDTGEVLHITPDIGGDPELEEEAAIVEAGLGTRFLQLPEADSRAGYADMADFVATVAHPRLAERLQNALHGRGPFRRFKDVLLDYPEERERWFAFKRQRLHDRARAWLAAEGIVPIEEGD
jgi:hypothetical protein